MIVDNRLYNFNNNGRQTPDLNDWVNRRLMELLRVSAQLFKTWEVIWSGPGDLEDFNFINFS